MFFSYLSRLHKFPSLVKRSKGHEKWRQLVNRSSPVHPGKLMRIRPKQRVCSIHFIDGEPTYENPLPTLKLNYDSSERLKRLNDEGRRRKLTFISPKKTIILKTLEQPGCSKLPDTPSPPATILHHYLFFLILV